MHRVSVMAAVIVATVASSVAAVDPMAGAFDAADDHPAWSPPVDGDVVRPFRAAANRYGAGGHAGVDYRAPAGTPVRAAGPGVVSFTGQVAGAVFVVVAHGHDLRTTYAPMASVRVRRGDRVARGTLLGTASGRGLHERVPETLHFGLRRGDTPIDPLRLFEPVDLTEIVHLVPAEEFSPLMLASVQSERDRLTRWARGAVEWAGDHLIDRALLGSPAGQALTGVIRVGQGIHDWVTQGECTVPSVARARRFDTGRRVVAVAGLNSHWDPGREAPFDLPLDNLGYESDEVTVFSYAPDDGGYGHADTHVGPEVAAARLAARLMQHARDHPGAAVDLVGHSQGGVVVEAFLKLHYAGHEDVYPPIGSVVTLAAPHRGAPLAGTARRVDALLSEPALDAVAGLSESVPGPDSGSAVDLDPSGDLIRRLAALPLPEGVHMTTIAGVDDLIAPASRARVEGADRVVVNPDGWHDHSGILTDPDAVAAVGLALAGAPPPCVGLGAAVRARYEPHVVEFLTP